MYGEVAKHMADVSMPWTKEQQESASADAMAPLARLPVQYSDFAQW